MSLNFLNSLCPSALLPPELPLQWNEPDLSLLLLEKRWIFPLLSIDKRTFGSFVGTDFSNNSKEFFSSTPALGLNPGAPGVCFGFDSISNPFPAVIISGIGNRLSAVKALSHQSLSTSWSPPVWFGPNCSRSNGW